MTTLAAHLIWPQLFIFYRHCNRCSSGISNRSPLKWSSSSGFSALLNFVHWSARSENAFCDSPSQLSQNVRNKSIREITKKKEKKKNFFCNFLKNCFVPFLFLVFQECQFSLNNTIKFIFFIKTFTGNFENPKLLFKNSSKGSKNF